MDDPKSFYGWVQVTMLGLNLGCFGVLVLIIILSQISGKLSEVLVELRRSPVPPAPQPAPPAPPADLPALSIQAMVEARAQELVRQRDAAQSATPPPVNSAPAKPSAPTPRPAAPRPTPPKPTP